VEDRLQLAELRAGSPPCYSQHATEQALEQAL